MQKFSRSVVAEASFGSAASGRSNVGCLDSDWPLTGGRYVSEGSEGACRVTRDIPILDGGSVYGELHLHGVAAIGLRRGVDDEHPRRIDLAAGEQRILDGARACAPELLELGVGHLDAGE